jgi:hypothetical protein
MPSKLIQTEKRFSQHHHVSFLNRPVWQGVSMDSLKFYLGPSGLTLLRPATPETALRGREAVPGVARPKSGQPTTVFYPLRYPTPYGSVS